MFMNARHCTKHLILIAKKDDLIYSVFMPILLLIKIKVLYDTRNI